MKQKASYFCIQKLGYTGHCRQIIEFKTDRLVGPDGRHMYHINKSRLHVYSYSCVLKDMLFPFTCMYE